MNNHAVNLAWVLRDESKEVERLCDNRKAEADLEPDNHVGTPSRLGVALSGGGIRSAAVNLGLIQALANIGILKQVHYISGISGGGYILGWLTSWIRRRGFEAVDNELGNKRTTNGDSANQKTQSATYSRFVEPHPIRHLREYASYLRPRTGLGSGDTLAMISIYLRNLLLNQALIFSGATCLIALAQLLAPWIAWRGPLPVAAQVTLLVVGLAAGVTAGICSGNALQRLGTGQSPKYEFRKSGTVSAGCILLMAVCLWVILPTTFTGKFFLPISGLQAGALIAGALTAGMYLSGFLMDTFGEKEFLGAVDKSIGKLVAAALMAIAAAAAFLFAVVFGFEQWLCRGRDIYVGDWYVMLGLPAILVAIAVASYVHIGIFGKVYPDAKREWLGRLAGYELFYAVVTAVIMVGALRGPLWMHLLFKGVNASTGAGAWLKWLLPGGWIFTVLSGVLAGKSSATDGKGTDKSRALNILAKVAPPVFLVGVFLLVSWGVHRIAVGQQYLTWVVQEPKGYPWLKFENPAGSSETTLLYPASVNDSAKNKKNIFELRGSCWNISNSTVACEPPPPPPDELPKESNQRQAEQRPCLRDLILPLLKVAGIAFVIALILIRRLDVNEFSMHLFYRNRLVRAFLGASNVKQENKPETRDSTKPESSATAVSNGKQENKSETGAGTKSASNATAALDVKRQGKSGRRPSPFTGFALNDDVPLQELYSGWKRESDSYDPDCPAPETTPGEGRYDGPYPLWCAALNLTVGENLAWQKRKAASFVYSPLFCGWDYVTQTPASLETPGKDSSCVGADESEKRRNRCKYAYRGTGKFTYEGSCERTPYTGHGGGPSVGTAMAASGAAIAPNWGYHSSPAVAALLAIFNIRIGWWSGNPRREDSWNQYAPGPYYLIAELLGWTKDSGKYVYLSDGGHFENLGIYELVRRRMKYIIACDADADPNYGFEDLANAVEKCRRDFGVKIEIDTSAIKPDEKTHQSKAHFAVGQIIYPSVPGEKNFIGVLLYLKSSLTGDESADILGQRTANKRFPHDTTLNQFFNETQFEVYRALGEHMFHRLWEDYKRNMGSNFVSPKDKPKKALNDFFTTLDKDRETNRTAKLQSSRCFLET